MAGLNDARSDLPSRIASSVVLAPLALAAAYAGGRWLLAFWTLAALGVFHEWTSLVAASRPARLIGLAALLGAGVAVALAQGAAALIVVGLGALAVAALAAPGLRLWSGAGLVYAAILVVAPVSLRESGGPGLAALFLVFAVVWATDIAAYFAGRAIGGPRLWPAVSPKKTWSGAIGGALVAIAAAAGVAYGAEIPVGAVLLLIALVLSAVSQAGDLFESAMKRRFGAKDSGHLIPGHGGLMDRLDGFVFAVLAAVVIGAARAGIEAPARGLMDAFR